MGDDLQYDERQHLGYIVVSVTKEGRVNGLASGKVRNFRDAHAERREVAAKYGGAEPKSKRETSWRVAIASGFVR